MGEEWEGEGVKRQEGLQGLPTWPVAAPGSQQPVALGAHCMSQSYRYRKHGNSDTPSFT